MNDTIGPMTTERTTVLSTRLSGKQPDTDAGTQSEHGVAVEESRPKVEEPPRYNVVLVNDDYTPMDFVVEILQGFFSMDRVRATRVMLQIHQQGKAICGTYRSEIAETKVVQVNDYSRVNQHSLMAVMEQA